MEIVLMGAILSGFTTNCNVEKYKRSGKNIEAEK